MIAPHGKCWLCKKHGPLTKEHIPPEQAFNNRPLLLQKVDSEAAKGGPLVWIPDRHQKGVYFRSLCEKCNNKFGRLYGGAYVDFVARIAERITTIPVYQQIDICGVKRPLAILKQIMLQFVTANGPGFVDANEWVAPFVRNPNERQIPRDVGIYIYGTNSPCMRKTGVGAQIDLSSRRGYVLAEFAFWPLGTVISFEHLADRSLTPIHEWTRFSFDHKETIDVRLTINPVVGDGLIDFRTETQITKQSLDTAPKYKKPSEEFAKGVFDRAEKHAGEGAGKSVVIGHPSTF